MPQSKGMAELMHHKILIVDVNFAAEIKLHGGVSATSFSSNSRNRVVITIFCSIDHNTDSLRVYNVKK